MVNVVKWGNAGKNRVRPVQRRTQTFGRLWPGKHGKCGKHGKHGKRGKLMWSLLARPKLFTITN